MRYPTIHGFLKWVPTAIGGAALGVAAIWSEAKDWIAAQVVWGWHQMSDPLIAVTVILFLCSYIWAIVWTGQNPKAKPPKEQSGVVLIGQGLDHVRVEAGSAGRGPYEARFFSTRKQSEIPGPIVWIIEKIRNIFHREFQAETKPVASLGVQFVPADFVAPCSPICFVGLVEAKDTPKKDWTALRVVVRNDSDQNLAGLVAHLIRAEPEIGSLHGPIDLPLVLATKGRLDRLRSPTIQEQIPHQGFNLHAHSERAIEVVWLHSKGALEGYITHEAGEADFIFLGSQELYVEVSGAGHPIVAGVRINVADDDIQSWTPELIIEAVGEAHGSSKTGGFKRPFLGARG